MKEGTEVISKITQRGNEISKGKTYIIGTVKNFTFTITNDRGVEVRYLKDNFDKQFSINQ